MATGFSVSLYGQYLRERTSDHIIENDKGFVTYRYLPNNCVYIIDIFVLKEFRKSGVASLLADMVVKEAKERGFTELVGTVVPSCKGSKASLLVLFAYGMELKSSSDDLIICKKDI